jgi:hypothetical protein
MDVDPTTATHQENQAMTAHELESLRIQLARAEDRAKRARWYGDHAGAVIAASDARRILRRLMADQAESVR